MKKNDGFHHKMWKKKRETTQLKGLFHKDEKTGYHPFCGDSSNPF